jgi:hypothetical protein
MTRSTHSQPRNPLADMIGQPGGITVGEALSRAGKRLEDLKEPALMRIDLALAELRATLEGLSVAPAEATLLRSYALANAIVGLSGPAQTAALSKGAYQMCDFIEILRNGGTWSRSAMDVHINALVGLRTLDDADAAGANAVLAGLRAVTQKMKAA